LVVLDHRAANVWDLPARMLLARIERMPYDERGVRDHGQLSDDGEYVVASLLPDGPVGVWHLPTRQLVAGYRARPYGIRGEAFGHGACAAFWIGESALRLENVVTGQSWDARQWKLGLGPVEFVGQKPSFVIASEALSLVEFGDANGGEAHRTVLERGYAFGSHQRADEVNRKLVVARNGHWFALRAAVGYGRQFIEIWNVDTRSRLARYPAREGWEIVRLSADGALLLMREAPESEGRCAVWDAWTGTELARTNEANLLGETACFWDDDRQIVVGAKDGTLYLAPVTALAKAVAAEKRAVSNDEAFEAAWRHLGATEGAQILAAMSALSGLGDGTVERIARQFAAPAAAPSPDTDRIARLVEQLASAGRRSAEASQELLKIVPVARRALEQFAQTDLPSPVRTRLRLILAAQPSIELSEDDLRRLRAVHALRCIGTADARALLHRVADEYGEHPAALAARGAATAIENKAARPVEFRSGTLTRRVLGVALLGAREVAEVQPGSPAEKAGVRPGDQITSVAGVDVDGVEELAIVLARQKAGTPIEVEIERAGAELKLHIDAP
jgi:hypothetical protein